MRPVRAGDLDGIMALAGKAWFGLTSLPADRALLEEKIGASARAFSTMDEKPRGEDYLLVMEDLPGGRVIGISGVVSKVGGFEPFYAYRVETETHESADLGIRRETRLLRLVAEHSGPCEIGSLFLDPAHRGGGLGRLLSCSRFLLMAAYPQRFEPVVIAEMRGVIDREGRSPFWEAVGRHFFDMDFPRADYLSLKNKRIIGDLMPRHPLYVPLLPPEAQAAIGQVHEKTRGALKLLTAEGFTFAGMVDIFEAGPVVECRREEIRTVRESRRLAVEKVSGTAPEGERYLVASTEEGFKAVQADLLVREGGCVLGRDAAAALGISQGGTVLASPF